MTKAIQRLLIRVFLLHYVLLGWCAGQTVVKKAYQKLDYDGIRSKLVQLAREFPDVMHLESSEEKLGVPYLVDCDRTNKVKCVLDIVTITDFKTSSQDKVQVLFTGSLSGHERLGPQIALYLIEYLVSNFGKDITITQLLQSREIVVVPMPNAWGFNNDNERELTIPTSGGFQYRYASRDFPYNRSPNACLNTVAGRTLYRLLVDNLFVTAASFESGAQDIMVAYPWAGTNRRTQNSDGQYVSFEAPDFKAFQALGRAMIESAGTDITFLQEKEIIEGYDLGDAISASFPQEGQLTDWAYGAGWDTQNSDAVVAECIVQSEPALDEDFYTRAVSTNVRTAFYQIETYPENDASADFFGARDIIYAEESFDAETESYQIDSDSIQRQSFNDGYNGLINRNLRLAMTMIDMAQPYIFVDKIKKIKIEGKDHLQVEFKLNGCVNVTEVSYQINDTDVQVLTSTGYCNYLVPEDKVQSVFIVKVTQWDKLKLFATVDQEWGKSEVAGNVGPSWAANQPQTHFVRLRESDTYEIEHKDKFIKAKKLLEKDVSEFLPIAFKVDELTAAQIVEIKGSEIDPTLKPQTIIADLVFSGASKDSVGQFVVKLNTNETLAEKITLELKKSFIEGQAFGLDHCTLILSQYGDMRSFISDTSQKQPESYGTVEELVEDFECLAASDSTATTYKYELIASSLFNQTTFNTTIGQGILLRNIDQDSSVSVAYGVIRKTDYVPDLAETASDIIALCQDPDRLSILFYSALDQNQKVLQAFYQPLTKPLLKTMNTTSLFVSITGLDAFETTTVTSDDNFCSSFSHSYDSLTDSYTYSALSQPTEVYLKQTSTTTVDTDGTPKEETVITSLYEEDPFVCAFGLANPTYTLTRENFCSQLIATEFIDEVKQEIADDLSTGTGTQVVELEAALVIFGKTNGQVGKLSISHLTGNTDLKVLSLELDEAFIGAEASENNLCSLRVTQYGDMRSFVSSSADTNSFGSSEDMVEYFNCISGSTLENAKRTYTLTIKSDYTASNLSTLLGKGLLLKNINRDKTLAFGIFISPGDFKQLENTSADVTALCQDPERLSALFFTNLDLTSKTLYAYYSPLTRPLLETMDTTSVNVAVAGLDAQWVTEIATDDKLCSSFSLQLLNDDDDTTTITKASAGKEASVYLRQIITKEVTDTTTGEKTQQKSTLSLYEENPLTCTFGLLNPTYSMDQAKFCAEVADAELVQQIITEKEQRDNVSIVQDLHADLTINDKSKESIGKTKITFFSDEKLTINLELKKSFVLASASTGNLCALRLTLYGDMRSFISTNSAPNSHGSSQDAVEYFKCIEDGVEGPQAATSRQADVASDEEQQRLLQANVEAIDQTLTYELVLSNSLISNNLRNTYGQGILLKNISQDKTISYGVLEEVAGSASSPTGGPIVDVTALCQDPERVSMLFYTEVSNGAQGAQTLNAFYQPFTKELLSSLDSTNVFVDIIDVVTVEVDAINTNAETLCSSFSITFDKPNSKLGETVEVYLRYSTTNTVKVDGVEQQEVSVTTLYKEKPLKCKFGRKNPNFELLQDQYCSLTAPTALVAEVLQEQKDKETETIDAGSKNPETNNPDPNNPDPNKPDPNKSDPNKPDPNKPDPNDSNGPNPGGPNPPVVTEPEAEKQTFLEQNLLLVVICAAMVFVIALIIAITCCVFKCLNMKQSQNQGTANAQQDTEMSPDQEGGKGRRRKIKTFEKSQLEKSIHPRHRDDKLAQVMYGENEMAPGNISISYDNDSLGRASFGLPRVPNRNSSWVYRKGGPPRLMSPVSAFDDRNDQVRVESPPRRFTQRHANSRPIEFREQTAAFPEVEVLSVQNIHAHQRVRATSLSAEDAEAIPEEKADREVSGVKLSQARKSFIISEDGEDVTIPVVHSIIDNGISGTAKRMPNQNLSQQPTEMLEGNRSRSFFEPPSQIQQQNTSGVQRSRSDLKRVTGSHSFGRPAQTMSMAAGTLKQPGLDILSPKEYQGSETHANHKGMNGDNRNASQALMQRHSRPQVVPDDDQLRTGNSVSGADKDNKATIQPEDGPEGVDTGFHKPSITLAPPLMSKKNFMSRADNASQSKH